MVFWYVLFEDTLRVVLGLARVDGERLAEADGVAELAGEDVLLEGARGVVVVVVEADFAPADAARVGHCFEAAEFRIGGEVERGRKVGLGLGGGRDRGKGVHGLFGCVVVGFCFVTNNDSNSSRLGC